VPIGGLQSGLVHALFYVTPVLQVSDLFLTARKISSAAPRHAVSFQARNLFGKLNAVRALRFRKILRGFPHLRLATELQ